MNVAPLFLPLVSQATMGMKKSRDFVSFINKYISKSRSIMILADRLYIQDPQECHWSSYCKQNLSFVPIGWYTKETQ